MAVCLGQVVFTCVLLVCLLALLWMLEHFQTGRLGLIGLHQIRVNQKWFNWLSVIMLTPLLSVFQVWNVPPFKPCCYAVATTKKRLKFVILILLPESHWRKLICCEIIWPFLQNLHLHTNTLPTCCNQCESVYINVSLQQGSGADWLPAGCIMVISLYKSKVAELLSHYAANLPSCSNYYD